MKRIFFLLALLLLVLVAGAGWYLSKFRLHSGDNKILSIMADKKLMVKIRERAMGAKRFAYSKSMNTNICFLVDMSIESGKNRFFVIDLKKDSLITAGLVTHGRCNETFLIGRRYGNEPGCGCTSLGRYKIGAAYKGRFGLSYKLHGLDPSNSNAFMRYVVLHAHDCVPPNEVAPAALCQSDGCPSVSPELLAELSAIIKKSPKPVLLWIYE